MFLWIHPSLCHSPPFSSLPCHLCPTSLLQISFNTQQHGDQDPAVPLRHEWKYKMEYKESKNLWITSSQFSSLVPHQVNFCYRYNSAPTKETEIERFAQGHFRRSCQNGDLNSTFWNCNPIFFNNLSSSSLLLLLLLHSSVRVIVCPSHCLEIPGNRGDRNMFVSVKIYSVVQMFSHKKIMLWINCIYYPYNVQQTENPQINHSLPAAVFLLQLVHLSGSY